ncbi:hypothetical protein RHMOL_Rhmol02G0085500 [Rhododendron molle]|uniref:Uncharacterized protein n=1 Tax=Rhododendron molle TaxID=49168 RepID=A0ACC0PR27_RHOML|nr:hypothetical protein RHMOL_Rhmol02G0085500 [Rhododendron molle]
MTCLATAVLLLLALSASVTVHGREISDDLIRLPSESSRFFDDEADALGTRWAVLIAGSSGYWNYRHQMVEPSDLDKQTGETGDSSARKPAAKRALFFPKYDWFQLLICKWCCWTADAATAGFGFHEDLVALILLVALVFVGDFSCGWTADAVAVAFGFHEDLVALVLLVALVFVGDFSWYLADVCHAYQLLKKGGLKDENIVVFMYDAIAFNEENPRQGIIINSPHGEDVYDGVPKDYTGDDVTVNNFFAAILGNKTALTGGSGKVVDSGPNDRIFIYYTDHGGPGVLGMPTSPYIYANDLIEVLKKKHASGTYKSMVFYLEACESGSIFEGLLPEGLNIYATTASNAEESSWGTYCPEEYPSPLEEYETCLGDLYSIAWMEDCDIHNLRTETLLQQYELDNLFLSVGTNPANDNFTFVAENFLRSSSKAINQRAADLPHFWAKMREMTLGWGECSVGGLRLGDLAENSRPEVGQQNIPTMSSRYLGKSEINRSLIRGVSLIVMRARYEELVEIFNHSLLYFCWNSQ